MCVGTIPTISTVSVKTKQILNSILTQQPIQGAGVCHFFKNCTYIALVGFS